MLPGISQEEWDSLSPDWQESLGAVVNPTFEAYKRCWPDEAAIIERIPRKRASSSEAKKKIQGAIQNGMIQSATQQIATLHLRRPADLKTYLIALKVLRQFNVNSYSIQGDIPQKLERLMQLTEQRERAPKSHFGDDDEESEVEDRRQSGNVITINGERVDSTTILPALLRYCDQDFDKAARIIDSIVASAEAMSQLAEERSQSYQNHEEGARVNDNFGSTLSIQVDDKGYVLDYNKRYGIVSTYDTPIKPVHEVVSLRQRTVASTPTFKSSLTREDHKERSTSPSALTSSSRHRPFRHSSRVPHHETLSSSSSSNRSSKREQMRLRSFRLQNLDGFASRSPTLSIGPIEQQPVSVVSSKPHPPLDQDTVRAVRLRQAYAFLRQIEPEERGTIQNVAKKFQEHLKIPLEEARSAIATAWEAVEFEENCELVRGHSPEIHFSEPSCRQLFKLYPQHGHRYLLQAYENYKADHPVGTDVEALSQAWRRLVQKIKREAPTIQRALENLRRRDGHRTFKMAYYLHSAKNDPRTAKMKSQELWLFLQDHYPYLTQFMSGEEFSKLAFDNPDWDRVILDSIPEEDRKSVATTCAALEDIDRLAQAMGELEDDRPIPFEAFLRHKFELDNTQIDRLLTSLKPPPKNRKEAFAICFDLFVGQIYEYQKVFGQSDLKHLNNAILEYKRLGPVAFAEKYLQSVPLSAIGQVFLTFGSQIPELQAKLALGRQTPETRFFFLLMNAYHSQTRALSESDLENWKCQASLGMESVIAQMVQSKDPSHPLSIHHELAQLAQDRVEMDLPQGSKTVTRQFSKDSHRYDELILANGDVAAVSFPGEYPGTVAATGALVTGLEDLARGENPELLYLLQEMAGGQNPPGRFLDLWLRSDLGNRTGGDPRIHGFIMLAPRNVSRAIKKVDPDLFTAEYDFELRVTNQYAMERPDLFPPNHPFQKTHRFRIKYDIYRDYGTWRVGQPTWTPLAPQSPSLTARFRPLPVPTSPVPPLPMPQQEAQELGPKKDPVDLTSSSTGTLQDNDS